MMSLPFSAAAVIAGRWRSLGSATNTASTSGSLQSRSTAPSPWNLFLIPHLRANPSVFAPVRPATATTRAPGTSLSAGRWKSLRMNPVPSSPMLTGLGETKCQPVPPLRSPMGT